MNKMIKLSLVAAVAVTGLTTTASAANLEDAVKNTKMTGYVRYRLNTTHTTGTTDTAANEESKAVWKFTTPVNDKVTSNVKIVALADTANGSDTANNNKGSTSAPMNVTEANFVIKAGAVTAIAGLQTSQSPFFANNGDTRSHGVTALVAAGPATIAAAHYTTTTVTSATAQSVEVAATTNISALGAIVKAGPANVEAWYAQAEGKKDVDALAVLASVKAGPATVSGHYSKLDFTGNTGKYENTQVAASAKVGPATVMAAYATTGKTSGDTSIDGDTDGRLISGLETISTKEGDVKAFIVGAKAKFGAVSAGLTYLKAKDKGTNANIVNGTSASEYKVSVGYKMSKNFNISGWYDVADLGATEKTKLSRIEVKYTF